MAVSQAYVGVDQTPREAAMSPSANQGESSTYVGRVMDFVELHDQVETGVNLLDSLESFLSTFQKDLSAVSGQISELQDRSKDIENRLKSRRKIEKPLSNLLLDFCIPPPLATLILDTDVGEPWVSAIGDFERRLVALRLRVRVKAARDLTDVAEGLRIVAATKLRSFFLNLLQPIRTSMTTNMQVLQTSVLLKYRSLYVFLQHHAANVASEVQRAYIGAARTYYETGFRRYSRSLGWVKARTVEKSEDIVTAASAVGVTSNFETDVETLSYGRIDGPGVTMLYMADDKTHKEPVEALFRSLMLVLMDNATAEYTFVTTFFATETPPAHSQNQRENNSGVLSPASLLSPTRGDFDDVRSIAGSDFGTSSPRRRHTSIQSGTPPQVPSPKEEQAALVALWKQLMDPVLDYCKTFVQTILDAAPPVIPLLTMIRLTEDVMEEIQKRGCSPLESFIFTMRLQMWPIFQKAMQENVDAVKRYTEGTSSGYFRSKIITTDNIVSSICNRYVVMFTSFVALTNQPDETMIFSNLLRLRQELAKLIVTHTDKISEAVAKATALATLYDTILQGLSKGPSPASHPKAQSEIAFWREREEEARRRVISTRRQQ